MTRAPAGWYPTPDGRLRYWDGSTWTEHFGPEPVGSLGAESMEPAAEDARPVGAPSRSWRPWLGWGGLVLAAVLGVGAATATRSGSPSAAETAAPTTPATVSVSPTRETPTPTASLASTSPVATPTPTAPATAPGPPASGTALAAVAALPVKGRAPRTGYARDQFGQAWFDADRNGCDTRNDILRRDLRNFTLKAGTHGCLVLSGTLVSPYTAATIRFVRGTTSSSVVQIDHVVPLSDAWQTGAQRLTRSSRTALANDPLNLLAVDRSSNGSKSDGDAATWLPPNKGYRCAYVARQVAVKRKYALWVTAAERDAMLRVLATCPATKLPTSTALRLGGGTVVAAAPAPEPARTAPSSGLDPHFGTCREANAAGYGPYVRGKDVEYDWYRDRDKDGIVCER